MRRRPPALAPRNPFPRRHGIGIHPSNQHATPAGPHPACLLYPDLVPPTDIWVEWDGQEFTSQWMEWELTREEDGAGWQEVLGCDLEASYQLSQRLIDNFERNAFALGCLETTGCAYDKCSLYNMLLSLHIIVLDTQPVLA